MPYPDNYRAPREATSAMERMTVEVCDFNSALAALRDEFLERFNEQVGALAEQVPHLGHEDMIEDMRDQMGGLVENVIYYVKCKEEDCNEY